MEPALILSVIGGDIGTDGPNQSLAIWYQSPLRLSCMEMLQKYWADKRYDISHYIHYTDSCGGVWTRNRSIALGWAIYMIYLTTLSCRFSSLTSILNHPVKPGLFCPKRAHQTGRYNEEPLRQVWSVLDLAES